MNRNTAVQKSPAHVCVTSVTMQILHCWQNIKFSIPFLFTFFIRSWKDTLLLQSTVCGLISVGTWNSGKWLKFSAFHLRSPIHFHSGNRTKYEVFISKHGSLLTMPPYNNTTHHQPGSLQGGRKSTKLQKSQIASPANNSANLCHRVPTQLQLNKYYYYYYY
jgi:hypothetical protein